MSIVNDGESPSSSSESLISVSIATYHGLILKKDHFTFYINFNHPDADFGEAAEMRSSTCELLNRLEQFPQGFRLCAGLDEPEKLDSKKAFIEPFGEYRGLIVVRSRQCEFMLELEEMYNIEELEMNRNTCVPCGLLLNDSICIKSEIPRKSIFEEQSETEEMIG